MTIRMLAGVDFSSWEQPDPGLEPRELPESWLQKQLHEFIRKPRDLTPDQVVACSVPPVELPVLGLVRHMTQMKHVYLSWGLGGGEQAFDEYAIHAGQARMLRFAELGELIR